MENFMKQILTASAIVAALTLAGCGGESRFPEATGEGGVRAINAIPTSPEIGFLIEERPIGGVDFKSITGTATFDDLEYTFNFEAVIPNDMLPDQPEPGFTATRIASQLLNVVRDTNYTFLLQGDLLDPSVTIWESPVPEFAEGATNIVVQVGHAASTLGAADVYFADPATPPVAGAALGTIASGEVLAAQSVEAGEFVLTLTAPGDPANVLFHSETIVGVAGNAYLFVAFDPDGRDITPFAVRRFNTTANTTTLVPDTDVAATYRFFHASADAGPADVYVDDPLTVPIVDALPYRGISADTPMPKGDVPITITGDGLVLEDTDRTLVTGVRYFAYLQETSVGDSVLIDYVPDLRSVATLAKLSVINTVPSQTGVDFYAIPSDSETSLEDAFPRLVRLVTLLNPTQLDLSADSYDIYVTVSGEKTTLAGPITLDLARGDIVQAIIYETDNPDAVDVTLLPLP
jgi:hypothetical protein